MWKVFCQSRCEKYFNKPFLQGFVDGYQTMDTIAALNFGLNRGVVVDLPDDLPYIQGTQYGDIFPVGYVGNSTTSLVGTDYLRTDDGRIICDENGYPQINPGKSLLIGNREPIFMSGLSTTVKYKGWTLSALFEGRLGGDVANVTRVNAEFEVEENGHCCCKYPTYGP